MKGITIQITQVDNGLIVNYNDLVTGKSGTGTFKDKTIVFIENADSGKPRIEVVNEIINMISDYLMRVYVTAEEKK